MKRALVFQHMDTDDLGRFAGLLAADGIETDMVMLHHGHAIPSLAPYDLMVVLGGAMDVWMEDQYPWLREEKAAIREWVRERHRPYLGICLGHQLLADALGGKVGMANEPELGVYPLIRNEVPHRFAEGLAESHAVFEWHHCEVQELPQGAVNLASTAATPIQAMAVGDVALGLQFHIEFDMRSVDGWAKVPSYIRAIEDNLGAGAYAGLRAQAETIMPDYDALARRIWANFKAK